MGVAGGWPLTVWLTPDGKPFYGGTYFPPRTGDRGARLGFRELLERLRAAYDADPGRVAEVARDVLARAYLETAQATGHTDLAAVAREVLDDLLRELRAQQRARRPQRARRFAATRRPQGDRRLERARDLGLGARRHGRR